jgi:hypothetical protein
VPLLVPHLAPSAPLVLKNSTTILPTQHVHSPY